MSQVTKSHHLKDTSGGVPSFKVSHSNQAPEDLLNESRATNHVVEATAPLVEYQQLLSAYQCLQLERDMLRKALRAFRIAKTRSSTSW